MRFLDATAVSDGLAAVDIDTIVEGYHAEPRWDDPIAPLVHVEGDRWTCATAAVADDGVRAVLLCTGGRRSAHRLLTVVEPDGTPIATLVADGLCAEITAATAALAVRRLERRVGTVGILGVGPLGRATARRLAGMGAERLVLFDTDGGVAREAERDLGTAGVPVAIASDPAAAVRDVQVVVTATDDRDPVVRADWLGEGVTVLALGADRRGRRELDYRVIEGAALVVCDAPAMGRLLADDLRECVAEGYLDWQEVLALGDVVTGGVECSSTPEDRVVVKVIDPTGPALVVARAMVGG